MNGSMTMIEAQTKTTERLAITIKNTPPRSMPVPDVVVDDSRDDYLTAFGKSTLKDRYLTEDESFQDRFANCVRYYADDKDHAQRMYDYISNLWCIPSTPVLANGGTLKGNLISCFVNEVEDSLDGIQDVWEENVWLGSRGGGLGTYYSNVRSLGEIAGLNGKTSGAMSFIKVNDSLVSCISQGLNRRGAGAIYMDVSHPEIETFIEMRKTAGGDPNRKAPNLHHGVCISDAFMEAVENGDEWALISPKTGIEIERVDAQGLMAKILMTRVETGEPYLLFSDTIRRSTPEHHRRSGLHPKTSNLCVAPETRILTHNGYVRIEDVAGTEQEVWNGKQWSVAQVAKTGENQKLVEVHLSNGVVLSVTEYHKWKIQIGYGNWATNSKMVATHELQIGDKLVKPNFAVVEGGIEGDLDFAYRNGFYTADGTSQSNGTHERIYLYGEKRDLLPIFQEMDHRRISEFENGGKRHAIYYNPGELLPKFTVPMDCDVSTKLAWFAGFLDGDGTIARNGDTESIQCSSVNLEFLREVRLMLTTLGVDAKIGLMKEAGNYMLPDGKGGDASYYCQATYRLFLTAGDSQRLLQLGLRLNRLKIAMRDTQRDAGGFVTVIDIIDNGRFDDTYCFNEPLEHMGVFEGILTGNCCEITLPTGPDHHGIDRTALCCLFQLNLEMWDAWNKHPTFISDVARYMDNVLQDFIDNAGEKFVKSRYSASRERSIGIGTMGFHSFLQSKNISFESAMAKVWNLKFFSHIRGKLDDASVELAHERGACPDAAEHGIMERFSYKMAQAPTASVSIICGTTSPGIDPITANIFTQKTLDGSFEVKNRHLVELLTKLGKNTKEVWNSINDNDGSVYHLDFLTDQEKDVYKTAFEINPRWLIDFAADRAPFICQAQSLNLWVEPDIHKRDLWKLHQLIWKSGIKTAYYLRSKSIQRADSTTSNGTSFLTRTYVKVDYEVCVACE
jgi:ribonucleoside-diphosphate reductase alpha chain